MWAMTAFFFLILGIDVQVERNLASGAKNLFMPHMLVAEQVAFSNTAAVVLDLCVYTACLMQRAAVLRMSTTALWLRPTAL